MTPLETLSALFSDSGDTPERGIGELQSERRALVQRLHTLETQHVRLSATLAQTRSRGVEPTGSTSEAIDKIERLFDEGWQKLSELDTELEQRLLAEQEKTPPDWGANLGHLAY